MKFRNYEFNDSKRKLYQLGIEDILKKNTHLTIRNDLHRGSLAKFIVDWLSKSVLPDVFRESEVGNDPVIQDKHDIDKTPHQILRKGGSAVVQAFGDNIGISERGKEFKNIKT